MPASLEHRKQRIFARLESVYGELSSLTRMQANTSYGCRQSGRCCKVGLELHWAECEYIARSLQKEFRAEPRSRPGRLSDLKRALTDEAWIPSEGYGDNWCAFYRNGCSIYPFRPAVCRMYGPLLAVDDECPRERLAGRPHVYYGPDVDALVQRLYRAVDDYGRLTGRDRAIYVAAGVLTFLLPKRELTELRRTTPSKFWRSSPGYRTQFVPEKRRLREIRTAEAAEAGRSPRIPVLPRAAGPPSAL